MTSTSTIINCHAHLSHDRDLDQWVRQEQKLGVVKMCLAALGEPFPTVWSSQYYTNADVKAAMDKYPDFIVGMAQVNLTETPHTGDDIERFHEQGFAGLKFIVPKFDYSDERYFPIYERAEALGMPILAHTGYVAYTTDGSEPERDSYIARMAPIQFDRVARHFPNLKLIGAHLGWPDWRYATQLAVKFPNVYFDICGAGGKKSRVSEYKQALAPFPGADWDDPEENRALDYFRKLVFGTDNPSAAVWVPAALDLMDYLHVDAPTRERFFYRNAAEVFGWDEYSR